MTIVYRARRAVEADDRFVESFVVLCAAPDRESFLDRVYIRMRGLRLRRLGARDAFVPRRVNELLVEQRIVDDMVRLAASEGE